MTYNAIVLAAGLGKRMGAGENKQFITIKNKALILHTLDVFDRDSWCHSIVLVVNPKERQKMKDLVERYSYNTPVQMVNGGKERQESVYAGLKYLHGLDERIVFIHDGARPFVSEANLHELAEVTNRKHAALLAVPVTDTIKQKHGTQLTTLDRKTLWAAQTPQAFRFDAILEAHRLAVEEQFIGTDDASLIERTGAEVDIVPGSYQNIKLTTPEDLERAQAFLQD
ncbi:2-C-methyl-D-erythritol 4-phosphate cytidylyltransferase [Aquibacillus sediminis]|uniref:2-C-methyl-D-erythritol 4-phosphate cytidylyltransferase n=1 Tax=Aquibacillus sediminis TaxID=2574734 RepID=UPI0011095FBF|nr:2-C-methyl-D-erythritol 4-phosphate cytidylyltransferase [Aquibacillus sediminis]